MTGFVERTFEGRDDLLKCNGDHYLIGVMVTTRRRTNSKPAVRVGDKLKLVVFRLFPDGSTRPVDSELCVIPPGCKDTRPFLPNTGEIECTAQGDLLLYLRCSAASKGEHTIHIKVLPARKKAVVKTTEG